MNKCLIVLDVQQGLDIPDFIGSILNWSGYTRNHRY